MLTSLGKQTPNALVSLSLPLSLKVQTELPELWEAPQVSQSESAVKHEGNLQILGLTFSSWTF